MQKNIILLLFAILIFPSTSVTPRTPNTPQKPPKLTVVIVIDQFAYHYLSKLKKHFKYGIKTLMDNGISYPQAYHAHGIPETTPGHHAISTGSLPKEHGAILNQWINKNYEKVFYDCDNSCGAAVFQPRNAPPQYGKSGVNTVVDGLSDQFMLAQKPGIEKKVFALSLKSHPAIATANRMGKAIWFDDVSGGFTSSKKYFATLPEWITNFNKDYKFSALTQTSWRTMYRLKHAAYNFPDSTNYDFASYDFSFVSSPSIPIDRSKKIPFFMYLKTPAASKALIDLAKTCVAKNLTNNTEMLLWVSLSTLDLIGHFYGPDSIEAIDTLYHLDKQIQDLMKFITKRVDAKDCLFALTGDHGIVPIPELLKKRGITSARRIMSQPLIDKMNELIATKHGVANIVRAFEPTYFVLDKKLLAEQPLNTYKAILADLKDFLQHQPGIKRVWTSTELRNKTFGPDQPEQLYKTQLYHGRSGDLICMVEPYCLITPFPKGTSHLSPYEYDTHVPLVIYQKSRFCNKVIDQKVWVPQLPVTLAHILQLAQPSASTYQILPGV